MLKVSFTEIRRDASSGLFPASDVGPEGTPSTFELSLIFCGYPCIIYEKCCKVRYSLNRRTEETGHEGLPRFDTENKIFQDLRCYT